MQQVKRRIAYEKTNPEGYQALERFQSYVNSTNLDRKLLEVLKVRASQLNGCAYCIAYHSKKAISMGESEVRLFLLSAWRRSQHFDEKERAALAWTEAVTLISRGHVPDELYDEVRKHFSEEELVDLTLAIIAINAWNRLSISMRDLPD